MCKSTHNETAAILAPFLLFPITLALFSDIAHLREVRRPGKLVESKLLKQMKQHFKKGLPCYRFANGHGCDRYIRVKILAGLGKTLGEHANLAKSSLFGKICTT